MPDSVLYMIDPEESPGDIKILQEESDKYNVSDGVVFTGKLSREEALTYVQRADVCV